MLDYSENIVDEHQRKNERLKLIDSDFLRLELEDVLEGKAPHELDEKNPQV